MKLLFKVDGTMVAIDRPELPRVGPAVTRRASHVEPAHLGRRLAFRVLRRAFGEKGRVAAWTRSWRGPWRVDLRPSKGPVLPSTFLSRADAIATEVAWLERNLRRL